MSGSYALPYLLSDPATATQRARAYIPVAPMHVEAYDHSEYEDVGVSWKQSLTVWNWVTQIYTSVMPSKHTGECNVLPPLCDHKTDQVAVGGTREAEWLYWSFKGDTQDDQTLPWSPWNF